jgi:hypothetical protein
MASLWRLIISLKSYDSYENNLEEINIPKITQAVPRAFNPTQNPDSSLWNSLSTWVFWTPRTQAIMVLALLKYLSRYLATLGVKWFNMQQLCGLGDVEE